ncbi:cytochrome P450 [Phlebopus sp. FC_14]|nr:cytochrome P450 [Phlebopus sp. FC_14]
MASVTFLDVFSAALALYFIKKIYSAESRSPFPPGPKPLPLLGNLLDMPSERPWETFAKWGEKYGSWGIVSVHVLGQRVIIFNSAEHAINFLEKRSAKSSNRPHLQLAGEMIGWNKSLVLTQYGNHFKEYRKNIHRTIGTRAALEKFYPLVERQVQRFLQRLIHTPEAISNGDATTKVFRLSGALILSISHGYEAQIENDPYIKTAETAIHYFSTTTVAGASVVEFLPILKFLPPWFPGATFHKTALAGKLALEEMTDQPHEAVKAEITAGTAKPSFTRALLEERRLSAEEEFVVKWSAQTLYSGQNPTVAALHSFFLAMTLFPEVQRKAQAEIDAKIGHDRLPSLHDRDELPYLNAMNLELLRWYTLAPLGVAHVTTDDDLYEGYLIPKGSCIFANLWTILRDPKTYSDPLEFKPERFIQTKDKQPDTDPRNVCFGFGRRQCPGMTFAEMSLFIESAMILSMFNIKKATEGGNIITPELMQTTGTISFPCPFKCVIEPRSPKAAELVNRAVES